MHARCTVNVHAHAVALGSPQLLPELEQTSVIAVPETVPDLACFYPRTSTSNLDRASRF